MTPHAPPPAVRRVLLAAALCLGFALRIAALDSYGFSEDEAAKLRAIDAYGRGHFSVNAEHPMLMKLAMWGSLRLGESASRAGLTVAPEAALRWPNAVAGTATIALASGVATLLFSPTVGVIAALLLAFDPNVIAVNRLGKEDTFLVLFFFAAVWCYERAKRIGERDLARARRWYTCAGAAFGLMLASKYLPHLLGLYALFNVIYQRDAGPNSPDKRRYYAAMGAAFLAANFAILLPETWRYCLDYLQGRQLTHHGFYYAGNLYVTNALVSFAGVPATYYFEMLATKVPLPVLVAALIGIVPLVRHRGDRGFVWMRVMLFVQLLGYSLVAAKFQRYGLSILVLVDMLAAVGLAFAVEWIGSVRWRVPSLRLVAGAAATAVVVLAPLSASLAAYPYYSVNQNALGARLGPPVTVFPEEAYDYGVREAVREIARAARPYAAVISDAPAAVTHYASSAGRLDLRVVSLSKTGVGGSGDRWVIVQDGHLYFENAESIAQLRQTARAWREYRLRDTPVLQVYYLPDSAGHRSGSPAWHRPRALAGRGAN